MTQYAGGPFLGDDSRLEVQRELGRGASGTVYRVYDRARSAFVAVKVLSHVDPATLFSFKSEFRTLADLTHPNLLRLYELVLSGEQWLLTMELVEGRDFLNYVRRSEHGSDRDRIGAHDPKTLVDTIGDSGYRRSDQSKAALSDGAAPTAAPRVESASIDLDRLRHALRQLCEGLHALHRSGRLHRDLKPANVLVHDDSERLVICDFGLVLDTGAQTHGVRGKADPASSKFYSSSREAVVGTVPYMSPEQAMGLPLNEASDWYAVGVMLYHALTGRTPFDLTLPFRATVAAKMLQTPPHPCEINPKVPWELGELAQALLSPIPAFRPRYRDIIAELEVRQASAPPQRSFRPSAEPGKGRRLLGRERELSALQQCLREVQVSGARLMFVAGRSGMGKSTLVDTFLDGAERDGCLVLAGRCYEREHLPYKALDPLIDALSSYLLRLDARALLELLPPGTEALRQLFPVLARVPAIAALTSDGQPLADAFDVRRAAFSALRELFRRLSQQRPLVLYIDDLQWGDLDSAPLFVELLRPPQAPSVLLLCGYRSEELEQSALLTLLRVDYLTEARIRKPEQLEVGPLGEEHCRELASSLLTGVQGAEAIAENIAKEAKGSPFFVAELASHARTKNGISSQGITLSGLMRTRLESLPKQSLALLSLIAVADRPETLAVIQHAAQLEGAFLATLSDLEAHRFVHASGPELSDRVSLYHRHIRDAVYDTLDEAGHRAAHRRLAESLEETSTVDLEALFRHWQAAGDHERALTYAVRAAEAAEESLAYARAAELFAITVTMLPSDDPRRRDYTERRAHVLMCAGRGVEAAKGFFDALEGAPLERALELRGLAISQLLRSGQLSVALEELRRAQDLFGLPVPTSTGHALRMLLWRRFLLEVHGHDVQVRDDATPKASALHARLTALWGVGSALSSVDLLRGSVYQLELVQVARQSGDPYHLACAAALSAISLSAQGRHPNKVNAMRQRAFEMAGLSGSSHALSVVKGAAGIVSLMQGRFMEALQLTREAQALLRDRANAALAWDRVTHAFFEFQASAQLGHLQELVDKVPEAVREAEGRGDLLGATLFRCFRCSWAYLAPDQPEVAREQVLRAERAWQLPSYTLQHYYITQAVADIALYTGSELEGAWQRLERERKPSAIVRRITLARIELTWSRARLALALTRRRPELLREAQRAASDLQRIDTLPARAIGRLLEAATYHVTDGARALKLLQQSAGLFAAADMKLHSAVARALSGRLAGTSEGSKQYRLAISEIYALGAQNPERFIAMLAPGFDALE